MPFAVYGFNGSIYATNQDEVILKVIPDYVKQVREKNGAPAWDVNPSLNVKGLMLGLLTDHFFVFSILNYLIECYQIPV